MLRYEEQDAPAEDREQLLVDLGRALDRFESLSVRINRTNNATRQRPAGTGTVTLRGRHDPIEAVVVTTVGVAPQVVAAGDTRAYRRQLGEC